MTYAIEVQHLVKRFGGLTATNDVSFAVETGESVALIGPNGAGKTTIFSQIMGELRQTSGAIKAFGEEISSLSSSQRVHKGVSRTYQVPRPFSELTVLQNIQIGSMPNSLWRLVFEAPDLDYERELATKVGLSEADFERTPSELSMGDLRKLEMARTMATHPRVMLLDEVFAGLTTAEIGQISELIQQMRQDGMTFLIVSHDLPALAPLIDRAIAINRGTELASGTLEEVLENEAVRASYLGD